MRTAVCSCVSVLVLVILHNMYIDAHLHLADYKTVCEQNKCESDMFLHEYSCCSSSQTREEFERQEFFAESIRNEVCSVQPNSEPPVILFSFGIHPQKPVFDEAEFLYHLLETKKIQAIGECGFDFFTEDDRRTEAAQRNIWNLQLRWAAEFGVPVVIHCRKALPLIFSSVPELRRVPAVIFHGWGGSVQEAYSFLKKGVNAYFSLGKALLRGQKSVCAMAADFELERLLIETDAPYMTVKGQPYSSPKDLITVADRLAQLRNAASDSTAENCIANENFDRLLYRLNENFYTAFCVHKN